MFCDNATTQILYDFVIAWVAWKNDHAESNQSAMKFNWTSIALEIGKIS